MIRKNRRSKERLQGERNAVAKMLLSIWKDNAIIDPMFYKDWLLAVNFAEKIISILYLYRFG